MEEVERSDPSECQREAESAWKGYWAQTRVRKTRSQAISAESSSSSGVHGPSCPKSQSRILPGPFLLPSTSHPLSWDKGKGSWKRRILSSRVILLRNWVSLKGALKMIALEWTEPLFLPHYIQSPKVVGIQVYIRARFKKQNGSHVCTHQDVVWTNLVVLLWSALPANMAILLSFSCCCCSVTHSCPALCNPVDCSTPGFHALHHLPELAQIHVHRVGDAIQPSHPLSSPSPPAFNLSQHQGLFQWVSSSHQMAKVLELQHQSF